MGIPICAPAGGLTCAASSEWYWAEARWPPWGSWPPTIKRFCWWRTPTPTGYAANQVQKQLTAAGKAVSTLVYKEADPLLPDNAAVALLEERIGADTELVLGVGSGVINDLCKHGSWRRGLPYVIVATAPSMDGYASSGAACCWTA